MDKNIQLKKKIDILINFYKSGKYDEVISRTKPLLKKFPKLIFFYNILSLSYNGIGQFEKAISILNTAIKIEPNNFMVLNNLGLIHSRTNDNIVAVNYLKKALKIKPDYLEASINLAAVKLELNQNDEAIKILRKIFEKNKNDYFLNFTLGNAFQQSGDFKKSQLYFEKCLKINPKNTAADKSISMMVKYNADNQHLKNMEEKLKQPLQEENEMFLNFALGKAHEDCKNFKKSFLCYKRANHLKNEKVNFSIKNEKKLFKNIKELFLNNKDQAELTEKEAETKKTIFFIVGMPRSGTSLIEQIISSHSKVYGAGELNFITDLINKKFVKNDIYFLKDKIENFKKKEFDEFKNKYLESLKRYNFNEKYLIDKAPLNFKWIGFILKSLPNSKIIHCNRNSMDVCWSNYKNFFSSKKISYSYSFRNLGEYYKLYEDLMTFWDTAYKDKIYNVSYEKLTNNPEEEIKKLIEYCGLNWEKNCLNFHENKKAVATASLAQIRKPIYKSSVKNWENYVENLSELQNILKK